MVVGGRPTKGNVANSLFLVSSSKTSLEFATQEGLKISSLIEENLHRRIATKDCFKPWHQYARSEDKLGVSGGNPLISRMTE